MHTDVKHDFWSNRSRPMRSRRRRCSIASTACRASRSSRCTRRQDLGLDRERRAGGQYVLATGALSILQRPHAGRVTVHIDDSTEELDAKSDKTAIA